LGYIELIVIGFDDFEDAVAQLGSSADSRIQIGNIKLCQWRGVKVWIIFREGAIRGGWEVKV